MATQIKTRILNKYDLLANYSTFKPLKGEICIAEVTSTTPSFDGTKPAPIVGIKVGDGVHTFAELPWIQAVAGDVVKEIKELTGVADIDAKIAALTSGRKLATVAELNALSEELGAVKAIVNHAEHGNTVLKTAIDTLSSNTTTNLATKVDKSVAEEATSADKLVKKSTVTADINTAKGELNTAIQGVQTNLTTLETNKVDKNTEAIGSINAKIGTDAIGEKSITKAIADLQASVGDSNEGLGSQVADLKTRMGEAETAIGTKAAQADLTALQGRVDTAEGKITTLEGEMDVVQAATAGYDASKTIASDIQAAKDAAGAAQSKADTNEGKINTLVGSDTDKSVRDIAGLVISEALVGGGDDFDTLQEIAAWIKDHPADASAMNAAIQSVKANLGYTTDGEGNETVPDTVDARIAAAIADLEIGNYATTEALGGVEARVKAIEDAPYATTANVATAKSEVIGASGDAKTADTIYGAKAYADDAATTAKSEAISAAATAADAKYELKDVAKGLVDALAGAGNATTVKANADAIGGINSTLNAMNVTDAVDGVVTKVDQANGKITVTHKKITMDEFDPDATFIFYCGTASDVID